MMLRSASVASLKNKASPLSRFVSTYLRSLEERPLKTKTLCSALIFFSSDSVTQYLTHRRRRQGGEEVFQYQISRALSGAGFGMVATTWMHYWWAFLERAIASPRLPTMFAQVRMVNTLTKVALDQAIGAPLYIYSYYVVTNFFSNVFGNTSNRRDDGSSLPFFNQQHWQQAHTKASDMFWPTMLQHWKLWPAVHCVNFYFMPLQHRVLVQNMVLVFWSGYLSHLNFANKSHHISNGAEVVDISSINNHHQKPSNVLVRRHSLVRIQQEARAATCNEATEVSVSS